MGKLVFVFLVLLINEIQFSSVLAVDWDVVTPLDEYVHSDDGAYTWREIIVHDFVGVTVYVVNMTSQYWQNASFSTKPVWWHIMGRAIPDNIRYLDAGILFIDGGSNYPESGPPDKNDSAIVGMAILANDTGCVSGIIRQVPNQPIVFSNDPSQAERKEDSIIAWTWRTYLDQPEASKDPTVILRMPMTKAAKRGLDTIAAVASQKAPQTNITRFSVWGASKRGWTTWSLAATDRRIVLMAPMVFSIIHMNLTMMKHYQAMNGAWSFALRPYYDVNFTLAVFEPEGQGVLDVEDMITFKERFTMPLLEISSTGDQFFLADDNWNWWDMIPSQNKYLMMLPNTEHSMRPHWIRMYETFVTFWLNFLDGLPFPTVSWTMNRFPGGGSIQLVTDTAPVEVVAFTAVTLANDTRRDFRLNELDENDEVVPHPVLWRESNVTDLGNGVYYFEESEVPGEWVGFFIQATWEGVTGFNREYRTILTSQVNIIPDIEPHADCYENNDECLGYLV